MRLGNFPTGGALTADGRFLWTVSAGLGANDVRIVDTTAGASARPSRCPAPRAASPWTRPPARLRVRLSASLAGGRLRTSCRAPRATSSSSTAGTATCGQAWFVTAIPVPPPPGAPARPDVPAPAPPPRHDNSWPQKLAVSPDGTPPPRAAQPRRQCGRDRLGATTIRCAYVADRELPVRRGDPARTGAPASSRNEAAGTLSVVDLGKRRQARATSPVGPPLSHPQGVVVDRARAAGLRRAVGHAIEVVVVDLKHRRVERTISVGRSAGLGTMPVALALSPDGARLFVAESGADEIAVIRLPSPKTRAPGSSGRCVGRIPTADDPQAVVTAAARAAARRSCCGSPPRASTSGRQPDRPQSRRSHATPSSGPSTRRSDHRRLRLGRDHLPAAMVRGRRRVDDASLRRDRSTSLTPAATRQLQPIGTRKRAPAGTPLRADGPIKHVFFVVRENRTYDQLLGDLGRGNGDPHLGGVRQERDAEPARARRSASRSSTTCSPTRRRRSRGTSGPRAASVPDYVNRNWVQEYAGRGGPTTSACTR